MTESEWLASTSAADMLTHVCKKLGAVRKQAGRRRLFLFSCGCMRRVLELFPVAPLREAIELGERQADVLASDEELAYYRQRFRERLSDPEVSAQIPDNLFILIDTS